MTYFMSPDSNQRRRRPRGPAQKNPRGPKPKANRSHPNDLVMRSPGLRCNVKILLHDISCQCPVTTLTAHRPPRHKLQGRMNLCRGGATLHLEPARGLVFSSATAPW